MTNIRQWFSSVSRWVFAHNRWSFFIALTLVATGRLAYQIWSIYDSIPDLPKGALQMVGVGSDGARFVELDGHGYTTGVNRITVLVVFDKPMHVEQGIFRFEAKRELVDCSKSQIEFQGAAFYDDQGHQTISRVADKNKLKPFEPVDTEATLVCAHEDFGQPRVIGYRAALAQTQAAISGAYVGY